MDCLLLFQKENHMKKFLCYSVVLGGLICSAHSFAATATCTATNGKTGQSFSADGGGPNPANATQVAQNKAMAKCHAESKGWPGQCAVGPCN